MYIFVKNLKPNKMKVVKNTPYVKEFKDGILVNQITKETPYVNQRVKYFGFTKRRWETIRNKFFTGQTIVNY